MGSRTRTKQRIAAVVALSLVLASCGDDEGDGLGVTKDGGPDGGGGSGGRSVAGRGPEAGRGDVRDGGTAGTGTAGGGGGSAGTSATNMCDPDAEPVTRCGGDECPGLPTSVAQCTVSCCVDDRCGTRNTGSSGRACEPLARETAQCPDYTGTGSGGDPIMLVGCCTDAHQCGVISQLHRTCIVTSPSVTLPAVPKSCDPTAIDEDAGVDPDAG